jgi:hypothetical protein
LFEGEKRHEINQIKIKSLLCRPEGEERTEAVKRVIVRRKEERDVNSGAKR